MVHHTTTLLSARTGGWNTAWVAMHAWLSFTTRLVWQAFCCQVSSYCLCLVINRLGLRLALLRSRNSMLPQNGEAVARRLLWDSRSIWMIGGPKRRSGRAYSIIAICYLAFAVAAGSKEVHCGPPRAMINVSHR